MIKYHINLGGELVATIAVTHTVSGVQQIIIPAEIVQSGVTAVRQYVDTELERAKVIATEAGDRRLQLLLASTIEINVTVGDVVVVGELCYEAGPRSLYTVRLLDPIVYRSQTTVYGSSVRGHLHGSDTHTIHGTWLPSVVTEAESILTRLYQDQRHRERYAHLYELLEKLNPL